MANGVLCWIKIYLFDDDPRISKSKMGHQKLKVECANVGCMVVTPPKTINLYHAYTPGIFGLLNVYSQINNYLHCERTAHRVIR